METEPEFEEFDPERDAVAQKILSINRDPFLTDEEKLGLIQRIVMAWMDGRPGALPND